MTQNKPSLSKQIDEGVAYNPFDFVESCEPDCTTERHAYHQGQWDMAVRICKKYGVDPNPADGDKIPEQARTQLLQAFRTEIEKIIGDMEQRETEDMSLKSWTPEDYKAFGRNELRTQILDLITSKAEGIE